ncbi:hypothetical protein C1T17_00185 [Sphingobium sp. SCG-1]|uniref:hypothetical protein n=1 Tax=Sphingobium sp. SCG-1 TaxID=2072936 RepID=UPI000CD67A10|nr:hypothetical protein [Sphingobium sp. SCG-1]AUW56733.1 hypothetical protein C1T17_00185 [Sphingobium sp. SCG-1]
MYTFQADYTRKLIRAQLQGFFSVEEVAAFGADLQAAAATMVCRSGEHLLYVDTSQCALQAQDVVSAFQTLIGNLPLKAKRVAVITGSSLSRMQTRRILVRDQAMLFDHGEDAEHWLLTGEERDQTA